jgi:hypothetical protein
MRRVSHFRVAEGCLRSLWKSGSKKEALELTRPSGGAVVQRVHRPRPAWPERLVDSAARTDAMWVPSPGPVLREGRHRQMRRAANPTDTRLAASMASWRVSPAREANSPPLCLSTTAWRSPLSHDHALVLAMCVRGVSGRPGPGSPEPSPLSTHSEPQPYKEVPNNTTGHLQAHNGAGS